MTEDPTGNVDAMRRKFNPLLALGIFVLPIAFVWFLLRRGHSTTARAVGFVWAGLFCLAMIGAANDSSTTTAGTASLSEQKQAIQTPEEIAEAAKAAEELRAREKRRDIKRNPEKYLLLDADGTKGGFDTVLLLRGKISNTAEVDIKDPAIRCDLTGPSGTQVGSVRETLFEIIPANSTKRFAELNMGFMGSSQVAGFACEVVDAEALLAE